MRHLVECFRTLSIACVLSLGIAPIASAQDPGSGAADGTGAGVADPMDAATKCLRENGFTEGWSKTKKTFAVVGSASFSSGAERPELFAASRAAAFQLAMADAKKKIATFLAAEIASTVKSMYIEPSEADEDIKAMGADRAYDAVERSSGTKEERIKLLTSDSFSSAVSVTAKQEVGAVQCFRSFESSGEGKGSIAVVAILSPKSIQMAQAMLGQSAEGVKGTAKEPLSTWLDGIEAAGQLLYTQGVIQRTDENGDLCLIAFGHASPRTASGRSMDQAFEKADLLARQALRQFAGEAIVSESSMATAYTLQEFSDNASELTSDSASATKYEAVAKKLSIPGCTQLARRKLQHPLTLEIPSALVVLQWNVAAADASTELKSVLDAMRGSEGGAGRSAGGAAKEKASPAAPAKPKIPAKDSGGAGGAGSADDS